MSLRARLALLYTSIVGGILLLFGMTVYAFVSFTLINQIDQDLARTATRVMANSRYVGERWEVNLPQQDLPAEMYVQIWGRDRVLQYSDPAGFTRLLDEQGLNSGSPIFHNVDVAGTRLRIYTAPLIVQHSRRVIGFLQAGAPLEVVDAAQQTLLLVLLVGLVISMTVAGLAGWITTRRALAPLQDVTATALQITRADDLSRRIPYNGPPGDEVGQLITAFNQTLGRLENLFNTQRRFLADVGHELRTPLTVIKGNVDLMRRMGCADDESMDGIESEVSRLTRMVGDLLLLAQAESGKLPLARRTVELDTILLESLQQMRVLARDRLQLRLGEIDQVLVCGDQDRLKQVVLNLIGNAIEYTPAGGEVLVGLGKVENRARLTVSDTGPGIPAEDLPHIFERFYRGEKSRTRSKDGKGFGLGLSIAYWIVRNHDGQIEVSARQPQGTTFCVWLPLAQGPCEDEKSSA